MRSAEGHVKTEKEVTPLPIRRKRLADCRSFRPPALHPLMDKAAYDFETGDDRLYSCCSQTHTALRDDRQKALEPPEKRHGRSSIDLLRLRPQLGYILKRRFDETIGRSRGARE